MSSQPNEVNSCQAVGVGMKTEIDVTKGKDNGDEN